MYRVGILLLCAQGCLSIAYTVPDNCKHRHSKGNCEFKVDAWYYAAILNQCKKFTYSGCGGNANRFLTENECVDTCKQEDNEQKVTDTSKIKEIRIADDPGLCKLRKIIGNCTDDIPSFYYNFEQRKCKEFTYTGCGGNNNRFESDYQCQLMCGEHAQSRKLVRLIDATVVREVCTYQPIRGPCLGRIISWHYDTGIRKCRQFLYSGCGGNLNRFSSEEECMHLCIPPKPKTKILDNRPPIIRMMCKQPIDEGNCTDAITMWYFDYWSRDCYPFRYTGCGGNENRFRVQKDCLAMCAPPASKRPNAKSKRIIRRPDRKMSNFQICSRKPERGDCNEELTRFFFDPSVEECKPFVYSGCNGNVNRFLTEYDCYKTCSVISASPERETDLMIPNQNADGYPCILPPSRGSCDDHVTVWVFDTAYEECRLFDYSGCGGNENKFKSEKHCINTCVRPDPRDTELQETFPGPPYCYMRPNPGRCSMKETYYFHHPATRTCRKFLYGGCGGNDNRFETKNECEVNCIHMRRSEFSDETGVSEISPQESTVCDMPAPFAKCSSDVWYYNKTSDKCVVLKPTKKHCEDDEDSKIGNKFKKEGDCKAACVINS